VNCPPADHQLCISPWGCKSGIPRIATTGGDLPPEYQVTYQYIENWKLACEKGEHRNLSRKTFWWGVGIGSTARIYQAAGPLYFCIVKP